MLYIRNESLQRSALPLFTFFGREDLLYSTVGGTQLLTAMLNQTLCLLQSSGHLVDGHIATFHLLGKLLQLGYRLFVC